MPNPTMPADEMRTLNQMQEITIDGLVWYVRDYNSKEGKTWINLMRSDWQGMHYKSVTATTTN